MENDITFLSFLDEKINSSPASTDEIINLFVPFISRLNELHQDGKVSPLKDIYEIKVVNNELHFDDNKTENSDQEIDRLNGLLKKPGSDELIEIIDGYSCWEFENFGFYDALSDIYISGLILASLTLNLNLRNREHFKEFRGNFSCLHSLNSSVHPVIHECIKRMVNLDRNEREADLETIIYLLSNYKEQVIDDIDFEQESKTKTPLEILNVLQNRLYDFTRRNRLIYFKETRQALNVTNGSIAQDLTLERFSKEKIITWTDKLKKSIQNLGTYNLSDFLLLEDFPWLNKSLTAIRATSNKDMREYGFSQLNICITFLHWYNLKESKEERISSPLLLIPINLKKKKGVRDSWLISFQSSEAKVNPALKEHLSQVYGLSLPEKIDLEEVCLQEFYTELKAEIAKSEPSVGLSFIDSPNLKKVHASNKKKIDYYERRTGKKLIVPEQQKPEESIEELSPVKKEDHKSYYWDFDLSSTTIGNFNYRKMTLVRDYKSVLNEQLVSESFTKIFSDKPKKELPAPKSLKSFEDVFHIVPADPTQMAAIDRAQDKISYIIQGPPGTGKSQTISNLIADFAARDKRVLFVCEKRAALDVVYHRLGQAGLKKLCCLIHDSQDDKKAFIRDLKDCYETLSKEENTSVTSTRNTLVAELDKVLSDINKFYSHLNKGITDSESLNDLLTRAVEIYTACEDEIPENEVPSVNTYDKNQLTIDEFYSILQEQLHKSSWSETPFSILKKGILSEVDPEGSVCEILENTVPLFQKFKELLPSLSQKEKLSSKDAIALIEASEKIIELRDRALLFLVDKTSHSSASVYKSIATFRGLRTKAENRKEKNENWVEKLSPEETARAFAIAQNTENSFFRFLMPSWWKVRKVLNQCYNFSAHKLPPTWSEVLKKLGDEHKAIERADKAEEKLNKDYNFQDIDSDLQGIEELRELLTDLEIDVSHEKFQTNSDIWNELSKLAPQWNENKDKFHKLFISIYRFDLLLDSLINLKSNAEKYHLAHPALEELYKLPEELVNLIQNYQLDKSTLEYEVLSVEIDKYLNSNPDFKKFDYKKIQTLRNKYKRLLKKLHDSNARYILENKSGKFSQHLKMCNTPNSELPDDLKEFKKLYNRGRKELEHEFGKKMRYKSIRDLAAEDSGQVVRDLKPIWLMSPLSVSDTIPLDENEFDAVIFDEASQIVIEEAIPTLYRSKQFIIVGDEKQLPPTSFFNVRNESSEALNILNADSLLSVSALNVPSTLLGWHYRSKNEWLVAFSNAAFYKRQLLTVPEIIHDKQSRNEIAITDPIQAEENFKCIKNRPISFHFMENGIYENRKNTAEAEYIAQLVAEYLRQDEQLTLGIVAFSEAQQDEIESCLDKLAGEDSDFRDKYNRAQERTEDGHYEGLFVKNLENVQGDERDIMILSICYGKNPLGKMRMHFGPINQKGGQKRLNVIVTRARRHVAIVSSIKGEWITNDYNEGALAFKRYLMFAENISSGKIQAAEGLLDSVSLNTEKRINEKSVYNKFSKELDNSIIKNNVGTSDFKVPLALGDANKDRFEHALFDISGSQINASLEMAFIRPTLLENFGWNIASVSAKDVYLNPEKVKAEFLES